MLSLIIPWCNRNELQEALPSMVKNIETIGGDISIVNLAGDKQWLENQIGEFKNCVSIINVNNSERFVKTRAQNIGAKHTKQPYLFFCDCDIILSDNLLQNLLDQVVSNKHSFGTLAGVKETKLNAREANNLTLFGYELRLKIRDGTEVKIVDNEEDVMDGTRQAPGLLMVARSDFESINGYNGHMDGWGWEDQDMICRLSLKAKLTRINFGKALHISHDDVARMQPYMQYKDRWESRDRMFRSALANYDKDNFMGTYSTDAETYTVDFS